MRYTSSSGRLLYHAIFTNQLDKLDLSAADILASLGEINFVINALLLLDALMGTAIISNICASPKGVNTFTVKILS